MHEKITTHLIEAGPLAGQYAVVLDGIAFTKEAARAFNTLDRGHKTMVLGKMRVVQLRAIMEPVSIQEGTLLVEEAQVSSLRVCYARSQNVILILSFEFGRSDTGPTSFELIACHVVRLWAQTRKDAPRAERFEHSVLVPLLERRQRKHYALADYHAEYTLKGMDAIMEHKTLKTVCAFLASRADCRFHTGNLGAWLVTDPVAVMQPRADDVVGWLKYLCSTPALAEDRLTVADIAGKGTRQKVGSKKSAGIRHDGGFGIGGNAVSGTADARMREDALVPA